MHRDPYLLSVSSVKDPPKGIRESLRHLGPSFILSASIVGSGELIATTTLGAKAGFVAFWVIIVSCTVKVAIQMEFGKHTILTGETAMQAFNKLPGPRFGSAKWTIWTVLLIMIIKLLQVGGIVGGVAIILNMALPFFSIPLWAVIIAAVAALLVFRGYYHFIEKFSLSLIAIFTLFTFISLYFLVYTPYAISFEDIVSGLKFQLPSTALAVAIGAFGITGVGGDEIIHYNYWCLEKGYATYTGPRDNSKAWNERAKGWIRVMYLDAAMAMIIYTSVTAAFYLLGAAVLFARETIPEGYNMVESLSMMYTESLGQGARSFFLIGSFIVLFSTLFAALAAWTRQLADIFGQVEWIDFYNYNQRMKTISVLAWVIPMLWALMFIFIRLPVFMVISGGIAGSFLLLLVVFASFHFRYRRESPAFHSGWVYDSALWGSMVTILFVAVYGVTKLF